jgi:hypothetical protein
VEIGGFEPWEVRREKAAKVKNLGEWFGGDRGIRTPHLCDANAALSQLSYIPTTRIITYFVLSPHPVLNLFPSAAL